jgi:hypothetical protein
VTAIIAPTIVGFILIASLLSESDIFDALDCRQALFNLGERACVDYVLTPFAVLSR